MRIELKKYLEPYHTETSLRQKTPEWLWSHYDSVRDMFITQAREGELPTTVSRRSNREVEIAIRSYIATPQEIPQVVKRRAVNSTLIKSILIFEKEPRWEPTEEFIRDFADEYKQALTELEEESNQPSSPVDYQ